MADSNMQLHWTDEQWNKVRQVVYEEARRARVAGNLLPLYGPLEPDATYVSKDLLTYDERPSGALTAQTITVNDRETQPLLTLQIEVFLRGAQVADSELTSALSAFRRAANVLARLEDSIIFNGNPTDVQVRAENARKALTKAQEEQDEAKRKLASYAPASPSHAHAQNELTLANLKFTNAENEKLLAEQEESRSGGKPNAINGLRLLPSIFGVTGAGTSEGLLDAAIPLNSLRAKGLAAAGTDIVSNISGAIGSLEAAGHLGPFGCVLDQQYFTDIQTPSGSLVLPQDRILPFLAGGTLLRSSTLPKNTGLVIALGGAPIDLVVATDVSVNFLQVTLEPRYVFRVHEKIALRVKEREALVRI